MPSEQRKFFRSNGSGCAFAATAAKDMAKYGWTQIKSDVDPVSIDKHIKSAIRSEEITTLSLLFPDVDQDQNLKELIENLEKCDSVYLENRFESNDNYGFQFRARVNELTSWVTGFGPFEYLPVTRQSPRTEITIRVKPRPLYAWNFKETPEGIIHLADLDMKGMSDKHLWNHWRVSFERTKRLLGHEPDQESAAKTTFVVPKKIIDRISD
ncbi:hypothetical protein [Sphingorhabdus sp. YGSMI21]|uniref:hypothetical protein n=1 Tax=Sphingorhabdus sp. YGSMI21 TaxID=2077182 RepID=UPI000F4ED24D|nr:hypothetical protein [Sphingorhabdus sp. YGSMI21]